MARISVTVERRLTWITHYWYVIVNFFDKPFRLCDLENETDSVSVSTDVECELGADKR